MNMYSHSIVQTTRLFTANRQSGLIRKYCNVECERRMALPSRLYGWSVSVNAGRLLEKSEVFAFYFIVGNGLSPRDKEGEANDDETNTDGNDADGEESARTGRLREKAKVCFGIATLSMG